MRKAGLIVLISLVAAAGLFVAVGSDEPSDSGREVASEERIEIDATGVRESGSDPATGDAVGAGPSQAEAPSLDDGPRIELRSPPENPKPWDGTARIVENYLGFVSEAGLDADKEAMVRRVLLDAQLEFEGAKERDLQDIAGGSKADEARAARDIATALHYETEQRLREILTEQEFSIYKRHGNSAVDFMEVKPFVAVNQATAKAN